jgi:hypothetical protein
VRRLASIKKAGHYGDGRGLLLKVKPSGRKSWVASRAVERFGAEPVAGAAARRRFYLPWSAEGRTA